MKGDRQKMATYFFGFGLFTLMFGLFVGNWISRTMGQESAIIFGSAYLIICLFSAVVLVMGDTL